MCGTTGRVQPVDEPGPLPQALGALAVLDAGVEHHLHADADAQHRTTAGEPTLDDLLAADRAQAGHHRGEGADPGHDEAVGADRGVLVGGELDVRAHARQRAHGRPDVAEAVVEHDDAGSRHRASLSGRPRRTTRRAAGVAAGRVGQPAAGGPERRAPRPPAREWRATYPFPPSCTTPPQDPSTATAPHQQTLDLAGAPVQHQPGCDLRGAAPPVHRVAASAPSRRTTSSTGVLDSSREIASAARSGSPGSVLRHTATAPTGVGAASTSTPASAQAAANGPAAATWVSTTATTPAVGSPARPPRRAARSQGALGGRHPRHARVQRHGRRSARASALNWASTMWCGSRPASTRTCRQIRAWKANDSKTWRVNEPVKCPPIRWYSWPSGSPVWTQ